VSAEEQLIDRAQLMMLTAPEMTALAGGMRVLNANTGGAQHGGSPSGRGAHHRLLRQPARYGHGVDGGGGQRRRVRSRDRATGEVKWTATRVDLVFGSNSQLRALAEVYAQSDSQKNS